MGAPEPSYSLCFCRSRVKSKAPWSPVSSTMGAGSLAQRCPRLANSKLCQYSGWSRLCLVGRGSTGRVTDRLPRRLPGRPHEGGSAVRDDMLAL
jgi:hypothetical protein